MINIELIRKYYQGELSTKEMNAIEAEALEDPFLKDAMDGYALDHENFDRLSAIENALDNRIKNNRRNNHSSLKIIPLWMSAIAATLVIALGWIIYINLNPKTEQLANNPKYNDQIDTKPRFGPPPGSSSEEEEILNNANSSRTQNAKQTETPKDVDPEIAAAASPVNQSLPSADGMMESTADLQEKTANPVRKSRTARLPENELGAATAASTTYIKGIIISEETRERLSDVKVENINKKISVFSNYNGQFEIVFETKDSLQFSLKDYQTILKQPLNSDTLKITMKLHKE